MTRSKFAVPATLFAAGAFVHPAQAATVDYTASTGGTAIDLVGDSTPEYLFYAGAAPSIVPLEAVSTTSDLPISTLQGKPFLSNNTIGARSDTAYYPTAGDPTLSKTQDTSIDGYYGLRFTASGVMTPLMTTLDATFTPGEYEGYALVDRDGTHISDITIREVGSAVPEPATWATMILGLGAAGAMMRQRRRSEGSALAAA